MKGNQFKGSQRRAQNGLVAFSNYIRDHCLHSHPLTEMVTILMVIELSTCICVGGCG
jgi:hypothetical protein